MRAYVCIGLMTLTAACASQPRPHVDVFDALHRHIALQRERAQRESLAVGLAWPRPVSTESSTPAIVSSSVEPEQPAATTAEAARLQLDSPTLGHVREAALLFQIPRALILAMIEVESAGNVSATSPRGAIGLMQLMPATATRMGVGDVRAARDNILGGTRYLRQLVNQFRGNLALALAAYNAGPGAVRRYGGIPPYRETLHYVRAVLSRYQKHARLFS